MKTKHTPGPWQHVELIKDRVTILCNGGKQVVTRIQNTVSEQALSEEDYANARLIAAAPELLEALIGLVLVHADYSDEVTAAHAAIRKALGEEK